MRSLEYLKSFFQGNKELKAYKGSVNVNNQRGICMKENDPRYLEIFRMIDTNIVEIMLHEDMPFTKSLIIRRKADGSTFFRELSQDSSGVREYFAWAVEIFKVVYEDKIVFADEMDRVLNPVLSDRVVAFVNGKAHRG